jgi:hypothetical protein
MRNRLFAALALTFTVLFGAPPALTGDDAPTALIPREDQFGKPLKAGAAISPVGKWISWLAPREGVMNVFVGPKDNPQDGFFVTSEKRRVTSYRWAYSSSHIPFYAGRRRRRELAYFCRRPRNKTRGRSHAFSQSARDDPKIQPQGSR